MSTSKLGFEVISKLLSKSVVWGGLPMLRSQDITISNNMAAKYALPSFKYEKFNNTVDSIMMDYVIDADGITLVVTGITVVANETVKLQFNEDSCTWAAIDLYTRPTDANTLGYVAR